MADFLYFRDILDHSGGGDSKMSSWVGFNKLVMANPDMLTLKLITRRTNKNGCLAVIVIFFDRCVNFKHFNHTTSYFLIKITL